jgi:hypothetical protein
MTSAALRNELDPLESLFLLQGLADIYQQRALRRRGSVLHVLMADPDVHPELASQALRERVRRVLADLDGPLVSAMFALLLLRGVAGSVVRDPLFAESLEKKGISVDQWLLYGLGRYRGTLARLAYGNDEQIAGRYPG